MPDLFMPSVLVEAHKHAPLRIQQEALRAAHFDDDRAQELLAEALHLAALDAEYWRLKSVAAAIDRAAEEDGK